MYSLLVRSYFEVHGNFDNIKEDYNGLLEPIINEAKARNIDVDEFCYQCLGYTSDTTSNAKAKYIERKNSCKLKTKNSSNKREESKYLSSTPYFYYRDVRQSKNLDTIILIVNFIENTDMIRIPLAEGKIYIRQLFQPLKLNTKKELSGRVKSGNDPYVNLVAKIIAKSTIIDKSKKAYSIAGKLFLPEMSEEETEVLVKDVFNHLTRRAQFMYYSHYEFIVSNLSSYQISDLDDKQTTTTYLKMIDLANIYDCTIQELIMMTGFRYVNQLEVCALVGFFVYPLTNNQYYVIDPFDETNIIESPSVVLQNTILNLYKEKWK